MYIEFLKEFTLRALGADEAARFGTMKSIKPEETDDTPIQERVDI
jgi:hypothetical protein